MPLLSGPRLDQMVTELKQWYLDMRLKLMKELEEGYPYGSVKLTQREQLSRFLQMGSAEWQEFESKLSERYRGQPNQRELVQQEIQDYIAHMTRLSYGGA